MSLTLQYSNLLKQKIHALSMFAVFFGVFYFPSLAVATEAEQLQKKEAFANELLSEGDFFRSFTVFRETEFNHRGTKTGLRAARKGLGILLEAKDYDEASRWLMKTHDHYAHLLSDIDWLRVRGELAFLYGNYDESLELLKKSNANKMPITLMAASALDPNSNYLETMPCSDPKACTALKNIAHEYSASSKKSPTIALALGIVPGLGQIYSGSFWSGIASFVVNGLLIGTTIYGINNHETAFAIVSGTFGAGVYFGSIYAGYETAHRFNEVSLEKTRNTIRNFPMELQLFQLAF